MRQPREPSSYSGENSGRCQWRAFGIALSLANICFLQVWANCLPVALENDIFYVKALPPPSYYGALVANVVLLGVVCWASDCFLRRSTWRLVRLLPDILFGLALILAANGLRYRVPTMFLGDAVGVPSLLIILSVGGAAVVAVLHRWHTTVIKATRNLLLVLLPFVAVTFGHAAWAAWGPVRGSLEDPPSAGPPVGGHQPLMRVVLLIFDELDYAVSFEKRPAGVNLPHLDRLREEAISASAAVPPGLNTDTSIPSMLLGRVAAQVLPMDAQLAMVQFDEEEPIPWNDQSSLFSRVRGMGFQIAVRGWYLPYCRGFARSLTSCAWEYHLRDYSGMTAWEASLDQWGDLFFTVPLTYRAAGGDKRLDRDRVKQYVRLLEGARAVVVDKETAFAFLHFPVPHPPCIYDRAEATFRTDGQCDYSDNLALVDRTVGELRAAMEETGVWEKTALLVISDHPWRRSPHQDARVPLLLRLPGEEVGASFGTPINTVVLYDLIPALLRGELETTEGLLGWLEARGSAEDGGTGRLQPPE